jgi:hypothetical protein
MAGTQGSLNKGNNRLKEMIILKLVIRHLWVKVIMGMIIINIKIYQKVEIALLLIKHIILSKELDQKVLF